MDKGSFREKKKMELSNYRRRLVLSPGLFAQSAHFFLGRALRRIERGASMDSGRFYPAYAKAALPEGLGVKDARWPFPLCKGKRPIKGKASFDSIGLAGKALELRHGAIPWDMDFDDPEDLMSLHRWNWLLVKLSESGPDSRLGQWGVAMMEDWIRRHPVPSDGPVWGTYTTCERISNGILFHLLTGQRPSEEMARFFLGSALAASARLEYHGGPLTGNHIINNARALYLAGRFMGVHGLSRLAIKVLEMELPRLVSTDGFLREGSSHYHFLITRWVMEVLWAARNTGDMEMVSLIRDTAGKMVERCSFFLVRDMAEGAWTMPLIGDVSPDFSPDWLIDLPRSGMALSLGVGATGENGFLPLPRSGWASLFDCQEAVPALPVEAPCPARRFESFPESGISRLDLGRATVFFNSGQDYGPRPTHGHNDRGSFSLFLDGAPLIVDSGRMSYRDDAMGLYGQSALSHNTITINGFEPDPFPDPHKYPPWYRPRKKDLRATMSGNGLELSVSMPGFQRVAQCTPAVVRSFHARQGFMEICDHFGQGCTAHVEARFHVSPGTGVFAMGPRTFSLSMPGHGKTMLEALSSYPASAHVIRDGDRGLGGWHFARYGEKLASHTIVFEWDIRPPARVMYRIGWG